MSDAVPIALVTGLLVAGKTTRLNRPLKHSQITDTTVAIKKAAAPVQAA